MHWAALQCKRYHINYTSHYTIDYYTLHTEFSNLPVGPPDGIKTGPLEPCKHDLHKSLLKEGHYDDIRTECMRIKNPNAKEPRKRDMADIRKGTTAREVRNIQLHTRCKRGTNAQHVLLI